MTPQVALELAALRQSTVAELRRRFAELFGEPPRSSNKVWLVRRLAWRLQALAEGDLSERARRRAAELARDADLRLLPPRPSRAIPRPAPPPTSARPVDPRLPRPGSVLTRRYKGNLLHVRVLEQGFAFEGRVFASVSAVAQAVTGSHCNGFAFFGLTGKGGQP
jgi:Protein of unknown function (DUF2924)